MELVRERELRETLERQLSVEQKNRGVLTTHTQHTGGSSQSFRPGYPTIWQAVIYSLLYVFFFFTSI